MLTIKLHNYTQEDTDTLLWSIQYLLMEADKGHTPLAPAPHADLIALADFLTAETQTGYPHCYHPRTPRPKTDFVNNDAKIEMDFYNRLVDLTNRMFEYKGVPDWLKIYSERSGFVNNDSKTDFVNNDSKTDFVNNDFVNNDSKTDFVNNDFVNND